MMKVKRSEMVVLSVVLGGGTPMVLEGDVFVGELFCGEDKAAQTIMQRVPVGSGQHRDLVDHRPGDGLSRNDVVVGTS